MTNNILIALTNPTSLEEDGDFNKGYNESHGPTMIERVDGIKRMTRFRASVQLDPPKETPTWNYLAVYDVENPQETGKAVLAEDLSGTLPPFPWLNESDFDSAFFEEIYSEAEDGYEPGDGSERKILIALVNVLDPTRDEAFNHWYNHEHGAELIAQVEGLKKMTRYKNIFQLYPMNLPVPTYQYLTIYEVEGNEIEIGNQINYSDFPWTPFEGYDAEGFQSIFFRQLAVVD